jgi:hypothetical protein
MRAVAEMTLLWSAAHEARSKVRMSTWKTVPLDRRYWHPINSGFNSTNSQYICPDCGTTKSVACCSECGHGDFQLGTSMGLQGVFCQQCQIGGISWECLDCKDMKKMFLVFHYDPARIEVKKRGFWG